MGRSESTLHSTLSNEWGKKSDGEWFLLTDEDIENIGEKMDPKGVPKVDPLPQKPEARSHKPDKEEKDICPKPAVRRISYSTDFEEFWLGYLTDPNMSKSKAFDEWRKLNEDARHQAIASLPSFQAYCKQNDWYRPVHAARYLKEKRFTGHLDGSATGAPDLEDLRKIMQA